MRLTVQHGADPEGYKYNEAPEGWREISQGEFAQSWFFIYAFDSVDYKQILYYADGTRIEGPMIPAILFNRESDNTGIAMVHDFWGGVVKYYAYGCDHKFDEIAPSQPWACWHTYKCKKCGHTKSHDSSD